MGKRHAWAVYADGGWESPPDGPQPPEVPGYSIFTGISKFWVLCGDET